MYLFLLIVGILFLSVVVNKLLWKRKITIIEMGCNFLIMVALLGIFWGISVSNRLSDTEILNGEVIGKERDTVSCRHGYPCRCFTTCSGGKYRTCSTHCSTCYLHSFDYDWIVKSNIGNFYIDTLDSQGLQEPPRYSKVVTGDPVSKPHSFNNYIKGSETSIFGRTIEFSKEELKQLPIYPNQIYDYYKVNRVIDLTKVLTKAELEKANQDISEMLKKTGFKKQANAVVVLTNESEDFALKLIENWYGGKKNDTIIIIGLKGKEITYVRIHSWSTHSLFDIQLRDSILEMKTFAMPTVISIIDKELNSNNYIRRSFKEFEYLRWQIMPSDFSLFVFIILSLILSTSIGYFMSKNSYEEYEPLL